MLSAYLLHKLLGFYIVLQATFDKWNAQVNYYEKAILSQNGFFVGSAPRQAQMHKPFELPHENQ